MKALKGMSAKDFKEPLLQVLGELTSFSAGKQIKFTETYEPVCQIVGVTLDAFGIQEATKRPWVAQWIGWAFRELKSDGLAFSEKKGQWGITIEGILTLKGQTPPSKARVVTPKVVDSSPASVLPSPSLGEVRQGAVPSTAPALDPYLCNLATQKAKCYGDFSERSQMCEQCVLAKPCMKQRASTLSLLAAEIRSKIQVSGVKKHTARTTHDLDRMTGRSTKRLSRIKNQIPKGQVENCLSGGDFPCVSCQQIVPETTAAIWIKEGARDYAGIHHLECFEKLFEIMG